ncbi:MAG: sigma 54-interacting transcriptional regulator [Desulfosporosinus sp.]|nr:sigma 54-interacting transcriptional regulator [Desulfosporosinus sp.]
MKGFVFINTNRNIGNWDAVMRWVEEVMTPLSVCLSDTNSCLEALQRLSEINSSGCPVVDKAGELLGIVTMKALIARMIHNDRSPADLSCLEAVERNPLVIKPSLRLEEAWVCQFDLAVVIEEDGQIVGVLSRADLAVALYQEAEFQVKELEAILNSAHNGIVVINSDGRITSFNNRAVQLFTRVSREAIGRHVLDVVPIGLMETLETGKSEYSQEFRVGQRTYIMNRAPVIQEGQITGAVGIFQDISEVESLSQELAAVKELNSELNSIIQSSTDGLCVTDSAGIVRRVNRIFQKVSLVNTQDLVGRGIQEIEEAVYGHPLFDLVLQRKQPVTIIDNKNNRSLLVTGNPVFDEDGKLLRVVINLRDMTFLNQMQQELIDAKRISGNCQELSESTNRLETGGMIGTGPEMIRVFELIRRVAKVDSTVLLFGESGVGKEGIGKLLHTQSNRAEGPFIKLNCGAIPEQLLESELFGYEQGAFTGARREGKIGMFELAHNGTLLLDEIGDFPLNLQPKLLRVLQERELVPIGGAMPRQINVRILVATHKDLEEMIRAGQFREDLYFRLNVVPIFIPPLRQRHEDIIPLLNHFRDKFSKKYGFKREFSPEVIEAFLEYDWPGNVRELENMVERLMVVSAGDLIQVSQLPISFKSSASKSARVSVNSLMPLKEAVDEVERQLIDKALEKFGSTYKAAAALGVNQSTVVRRMARFRRTDAESPA